jgi:hypothetical protein
MNLESPLFFRRGQQGLVGSLTLKLGSAFDCPTALSSSCITLADSN